MCIRDSSGADIAVIYAGNAQAAAATVADIAALGVRAKAYACDVADFDAVAETVKAVTADLGPVYVLVNNAGITRDKLTLQMKQEDFQQVIDVNLKGAFNFIRHTYSGFVRSRAGRIINITSVSGLMGNAGQANYAAAKAGLIGLTKSVARELAARGVTSVSYTHLDVYKRQIDIQPDVLIHHPEGHRRSRAVFIADDLLGIDIVDPLSLIHI